MSIAIFEKITIRGTFKYNNRPEITGTWNGNSTEPNIFDGSFAYTDGTESAGTWKGTWTDNEKFIGSWKDKKNIGSLEKEMPIEGKWINYSINIFGKLQKIDTKWNFKSTDNDSKEPNFFIISEDANNTVLGLTSFNNEWTTVKNNQTGYFDIDKNNKYIWKADSAIIWDYLYQGKKIKIKKRVMQKKTIVVKTPFRQSKVINTEQNTKQNTEQNTKQKSVGSPVPLNQTKVSISMIKRAQEQKVDNIQGNNRGLGSEVDDDEWGGSVGGYGKKYKIVKLDFLNIVKLL